MSFVLALARSGCSALAPLADLVEAWVLTVVGVFDNFGGRNIAEVVEGGGSGLRSGP